MKPQSQQPFTKSVESDVNIQCGTELFGPMKCRIEYSLVRSGKIFGTLTGYNKTTKDLLEMLVRNNYKCSIRSTNVATRENEVVNTVSADNLLFSKIKNVGEGTQYGGSLDVVEAHFSVNELTTQTIWKERHNLKREIQYYLDGPKEFWMDMTWREICPKSESNALLEHNLDIDLKMPVKLEICEVPFYDTIESEGLKISQTVSKVTMVFRTEESEDSFSDEHFRELTANVTEDMTIIASFASRSPIRWYCSHFYGPSSVVDSIRQVGYDFSQEVEKHEMLIDPIQALNFLRTAVMEFRSLKNKGINLFYPLIMQPTSYRSRYSEDRFTSYFQSLEKLKDIWANSNGHDKILKEREFNAIRVEFESLLETVVPGELDRSSIKEKLVELNRPPFWNTLSLFLEAHSIKWTNIYPVDSKIDRPTFINTRNKWFHTIKEIHHDVLSKETERVRIITEQLLLKYLGWNQSANFDPSFSLKGLTEHSNPSN
jgi:hypothetical protein